jgi:hypothetical protein
MTVLAWMRPLREPISLEHLKEYPCLILQE